MKHKTKNVGTPTREYKPKDVDQEFIESDKPDILDNDNTVYPTEIVEIKATVPAESLVRCIWTGSIKILGEKTPSGTTYRFNPGEVKQIKTADALYLVGIGQDKPGCCSGSGTPRRYFELA